MKKIVILGSKGRLGATLATCWKDRFDLSAVSRAELDITDTKALEHYLANLEADWVVNCSGMTSLEACQANPEAARQVNSLAVRKIAQHCAAKAIRFVHFSTDYVFNGKKETSYGESDEVCPLGVYGETKLEGERSTLEASALHFVFRVSWVLGIGRPAFPDAIIARAQESAEIQAVADKWSSPTSSADIADWLAPLLERNEKNGGLYHLCNSGRCSWLEYANETLKIAASLGIPVKTTQAEGILLRDLPSLTVPRPVNSCLSTEKFQNLFGIPLRSWQEALCDYVKNQYRFTSQNNLTTL